MTYRELIHRPDYKKRFDKIEQIFNDIEYKQILPSYNSLRNQFPVVTNDDYLDKINLGKFKNPR